jgi:hypothetical protein
MRLVIALVLAWTITPLLLEWISRKGFQIKGTPAWLITVIACLGVAVILNAILSAVHWTPFDIFALTAIIYFGSNAFFNLVIKPWFPTRKV